MADEDVATKAPESDAQEDSQEEIPGDTKVDQGAASMGVSYTRCWTSQTDIDWLQEHCTTDRPTRTETKTSNTESDS